MALALVSCLGDPNPDIRDRQAFESLAAMMRNGDVAADVLTDVKARLLSLMTAPDPAGFQRPFAILALAELARTDRVTPWMPDRDRDELVGVVTEYLRTVKDYRAFSDSEGFRHGVAHGADLAMQLSLNPAITKPQLDRLLAAIAVQVVPADRTVAYWAGEPDRLARPVVFIAQRKLHAADEWRAWFATVMNPAPLASWSDAFSSESGIRRHHNARAFLLSVYASAANSADAGIKLLIAPVLDSLKLVP